MRDLLRTGWRWVTSPTGPSPRPTARNLVFDLGLAIAVAIGTVLYARRDRGSQDFPALIVGDGDFIRQTPIDDSPVPIVVGIMASVILAVRRRFPLAVLWSVVLVTVAMATDQPSLTFYACVIAAYSAAAYSPYRVPTFAGVVTAVLTFVVATNDVFPVVAPEYIPLVVLAPIVIAADGLRRWKLRADERRTELAEVERRQAEALRHAADEERARIARELHDVVTHNVSVMVIQAGAARKVMQTSPEQAGEALLAVESGGRAAMAELRQAMGLLTTDGGDDTSDLEPQPGLASLPSLVSRVREAGLNVDLTVTGAEAQRPLPPGIELAVYRVVQEALTNTVKHASGASASVTIDHGDQELRVEVIDTGGPPSQTATAGNGRGLIGLRERLAVYDGTVETASLPTGGYRVTASIPLEDA